MLSDPQFGLFDAQERPQPPEDAIGLQGVADGGRTVDVYGGVSRETRLYGLEIVALDFEATGLAAWSGDRVCEVGLVGGRGDRVETLLDTFVDPGKPIPPVVKQLTGINDHQVAGAPTFDKILPALIAHTKQRPLVIHNAPFDLAFIKQATSEANVPMLQSLTIDTLLIARFLNRGRERNSLSSLCERLGIDRGSSHRARDDARSAALVFHALVPYLELRGIRTIGDMVRARLAGNAELFSAEPSSVLLDMLTRAIELGQTLSMVYAKAPGAPFRSYERLRPRAVLRDRWVVSELPVREGMDESRQERTFSVFRIMKLTSDERTFLSPWYQPTEAESWAT